MKLYSFDFKLYYKSITLQYGQWRRMLWYRVHDYERHEPKKQIRDTIKQGVVAVV